jgi:hypothetical protein
VILIVQDKFRLRENSDLDDSKSSLISFPTSLSSSKILDVALVHFTRSVLVTSHSLFERLLADVLHGKVEHMRNHPGNPNKITISSANHMRLWVHVCMMRLASHSALRVQYNTTTQRSAASQKVAFMPSYTRQLKMPCHLNRLRVTFSVYYKLLYNHRLRVTAKSAFRVESSLHNRHIILKLLSKGFTTLKGKTA